jgi:hypothetical protein
MAAASVGGARHDDDDSAGSTEGAMVAQIQAVATTMMKTVLSALQFGKGHVVTIQSRSEDQEGVVCHEKQWHCP